MPLRLVVCVGLAAQLLAIDWFNVALAQPALDRVEQQLRKQAGTRLAAGTQPVDTEPAGEAAAGDQPGYFGVIADDRNEQGKGVRLTEAIADGPAAKAGLKAGDLLTAIEDHPLKSLDDMTELLSLRHAGDIVRFTLERGGVEQEIRVRLDRRPPPENRRLAQFGRQAEDMPAPGAPADAGRLGPSGAAPGPLPGAAQGDSMILRTRRAKLGVRTVPLTPRIREQARLPGSYVDGIYVTEVDLNAPAGRAGLPKNAVITSVDGEPIDSPETLAALVHRAGPGQVLVVTYYFRDHESQATVTLDSGSGQPPAGPQATTRARPLPAVTAPPDQPPGFAPDEPGDSSSPASPSAAVPTVPTPPAPANLGALERRISELEKRVAELEAAAASGGAK